LHTDYAQVPIVIITKIIWDWLQSRGVTPEFVPCPKHADLELHDQKIFKKIAEIDSALRIVETKYVTRSEFSEFRDDMGKKLDLMNNRLADSQLGLSEIKVLVTNLHPWDGQTDRRKRRK